MSLDWNAKPCVYTIPAGVSFVEALARGILSTAGDDPLELASMQILLPTRRACRSLREAFLKISQGKPLLLPRMQPIGDVDEEELSLFLTSMDDDLSLPPSLPPMRRQFMLTRLISGLETHSRGLEQDMMLARALSRLMDQVHTQGLDLKNLPHVVDQERFSKHWQISLDFLSVLSEHWPRILAENGVIDAADRRNRLLKKLAEHWGKNPPQHKIIAAGSTGSIPATAGLLQVIAALPQGCIVLPGLDQTLDDNSWNQIDDTHPQAMLRHLVEKVLGIVRADVKLWPFDFGAHHPSAPITRLASEIMRPAASTERWQTLSQDFALTPETLAFERYDCANQQEEALVIALALREALEHPERTAALVTPDRNLAQRVAVTCRRWDIALDDSAGQPLSGTAVGTFLRQCCETAIDNLKPVSLLTFCKHGLCQPDIGEWRGLIRQLDRYVLRGPAFRGGIEALFDKLHQTEEINGPRPDLNRVLDTIADGFAPLLTLTETGTHHPFADWCEAHLKTAEFFAAPDFLWRGEDGESAAAFFAELREEASLLPNVTLSQYLEILTQAMQNVAVRPAYGLHPRLMILGQLEARLVEADVMILSGLNEGTWPQDTGVDPWMSRPMRKRFGLPPLERAIGLAAHDFAQAFCAAKVILTRSVRVDGTPTVPSRWLQRLDTVLQACGIRPDNIRTDRLLSIAHQLDYSGKGQSFERPAPRPPVDVRPRNLPVTQIERWMQDPYSIYARHILRLKKLKPLEQAMDAALRGNLIHDVLDRFVSTCPDDIPSNAIGTFLSITREELAAHGLEQDIVALWQPRLDKIGQWFVRQEQDWRLEFRPAPAGLEAEGELCIQATYAPFVLTARADRIDLSRTGTESAIIDYKSGGQYSLTKMKSGQAPQLPLEACILESGGFHGLNNYPVAQLSYWVVNGSRSGGECKSMNKPEDIKTAIDNAREGLTSLIERFDNPATPYYSLPRPEFSPRYNDYEHLARVKEWTALDDQGDGA